jgi:hypothetical protein
MSEALHDFLQDLFAGDPTALIIAAVILLVPLLITGVGFLMSLAHRREDRERRKRRRRRGY